MFKLHLKSNWTQSAFNTDPYTRKKHSFRTLTHHSQPQFWFSLSSNDLDLFHFRGNDLDLFHIP